jgi:hypothetical protein
MAISLPAGIPRGNPKLLDQVRDVIPQGRPVTPVAFFLRFLLYVSDRLSRPRLVSS